MENEGPGRGLRDLLLIGLLVAIPIIWIVMLLPRFVGVAPEYDIALSDVAGYVKSGSVREITVDGDDLSVSLHSGIQLHSRKESGVSLTDTLRNYGVGDRELANLDLRVASSGSGDWTSMLVWILPIGAVLLLVVLFSRQSPAPGAGDQTLAFLKSRARKIVGDRPKVRFTDVAGVEEAKEELQEIVFFLRSPARFLALGARTPRGVLLVGPPGTGKTLLARAVAGEAGVPFFSISGSEFVEMFVGVGASRVRDLFQEAKRHAPCIVFVDEIDAVGRQRGMGIGGGHDEREQTLNQILVEMDGFDQNTNIVVIAATNRPDVLDPALLRPGRFDRRVVLDSPDVGGREAILRIHARGKPLAPDVDLGRVARQTAGFSGADIENVMNEAALLAARHGKHLVEAADLDEAIDRVVGGPARRGRLISMREKAITAYHEAGHAVVAHQLPGVDPVQKVTIVPRGISGGHTRLLPEQDRRIWSRSQLADTLAFALGGLAAESLIFGEITTGPGSDLEHATGLAHKMVCEYGMSESLGPVVLGPTDRTMAGGVDRRYSDQTATTVDREVQALVQSALDRAQMVIRQHRARLEQVAQLLIQNETLQGDELTAVLEGRVVVSPSSDFSRMREGFADESTEESWDTTAGGWPDEQAFPPKKSA